MNRRARLTRLSVSLFLVLTLPGLAPYQAAAQAFSAHPVAAASAASVAGIAGAVLRVQTPSLGTSVSRPTAFALLSAPAPVPAVPISPVAAAASAAETLKTGASRVAASADADPSGAAERVELDALFAGEAVKPAADLAVPAAGTAGSALHSRPAAADGPRWVFRDETPAPQPRAPRTSLKRTLSVGFLAGTLGVVFTDASQILATLLGWSFHGNYKSPVGSSDPTAAIASLFLVVGSVLAPIAEEIVFRAGLQGGLAKLTGKLHLGTFLLPALAATLVFVAAHETADPVMFAIRFGFAAALSYVFKKEGMLSSMTAHGVFNGLQLLPLLFAALHAPALALLMIPGVLYTAIRSWKLLKSQKSDIDSGALAPKPFQLKHALMFLPLLAIGFIFLMPNLYWLAGGAGLVGYLFVQAAAWRRRVHP
ncbi:MAG TPA: hypothetical protein DCZ01_05450 [Elusimicrobia bacterium]|nr:MAG: hypothetical protein A2X37_03765 [Elusimicrobia bacterium GWA2_66_18]OGR68486.1 MAG: hypothetical protein A2X40_12285 [Elusimicrobia bacterium GWC2_65_9]HAZ07967.1 hypothetical protein [Elusimicrobiota bacterium]